MPSTPIDSETPDLLPDNLPDSPLALASKWMTEARDMAGRPNPGAMILSTCGADQMPSSRVVLCRELNTAHGYLLFFTNYHSAKARDLDVNPRAAATFHWDRMRRQIRVQGVISESPAAESNAYFAKRPWARQLGACASEQSEPIESREAMQRRVDQVAKRLGLDVDALSKQGIDPADIERPSNWGGYRLWLSTVELWVEGAGRIHDRGFWQREVNIVDGVVNASGQWRSTRLQP